MDDFLKIKVLMIYYDHWGKDEIRARKADYGVKKTMEILQTRFHAQQNTRLHTTLERMFHYLIHDHAFQEIYIVWIDFTEVFLQSFAFEMLLDYDYYTEIGRMDAWKNRLCGSLRLKDEESILLLYNELRPHEILSVDAIVALF